MRFVFAAVVWLCAGVSSLLADEPAQHAAEKPARAKQIENSIGMKFVLIPGGSFLMGSPPDEEGRDDDEHQHEVTLSRDFYLGVYEVTQAQYEAVLEENLSYFQGTQVPGEDNSQYPVDSVSWEDATEFCRRLTELSGEKKANRRYRLPTEAEWEYACRAKSRTPTRYSFGIHDNQLGAHAWYDANSKKMTHVVGGKRPNKFGLYDMHGNVYEWCSDWYDENYYDNSPDTDPTGPESGTERVIRGGCWYREPYFVRSADRSSNNPINRFSGDGFRVLLE
jgi:formylglycine-generating enzyme required for sulfatase activity